MPVADLARSIGHSPSDYMAVVTFAAYLDESYTDRVMAIGGYIAPIEQWDRFQTEWRDFLAKFDISGFHMTDFMAGEKEFKGWSEKNRRDCVEMYSGIIARRTKLRFAVGVDKSAFNDLPVREMGHYGFCVFEWLHEAERFCDRNNIAGPVSYVFDHGSGYGGQIHDALAWIRKRPKLKARYRLEGFSFENKSRFLPLQSADILAWEARRLFAALCVRPSAKAEDTLRRLMSHGLHKSSWYGKTELAAWKKDFDEAMASTPEEDLR